MGNPTTEPVDIHDPAGMAAFMRRRAECSREFLNLTSEEQIRQFMESWQRNVLPHFAFRFEQAATMIERLERALTETHDAWTAETTRRLQAVHERDCAVEKLAELCKLLTDCADPVSGQLAEARRNLALYKGYSSRERRYQIEIEELERLQNAIRAVDVSDSSTNTPKRG